MRCPECGHLYPLPATTTTMDEPVVFAGGIFLVIVFVIALLAASAAIASVILAPVGLLCGGGGVAILGPAVGGAVQGLLKDTAVAGTKALSDKNARARGECTLCGQPRKA